MHTNRAFIMRDIFGKNILMPIQENTAGIDPILLNDVAASIWKEAATETTAKSILQNISDSYGLGLESSEAVAVENFISQLITMKLLVESPEV